MLVINMMQIRSGGGLQNSLSFLSSPSLENKDYLVVCEIGGAVCRYCLDNKLPVFPIKSGLAGLVYYHFFAMMTLRKKFGGDVLFSIFGPPPLFLYGLYSVSGFAYSYIIQSDVDFWGFLPIFQRIKKRVKDKLRLWGCKRSREIIVETDYLKACAISGCFKERTVHVVKMEPSLLLDLGAAANEFLGAVQGVKILYLASDHPNKRIHLLPGVFKELSRLGEYTLVTSLPEDSSYLADIRDGFVSLNIGDGLINLGTVRPECISGLIRSCDCLVNVALLESFSNNWVESWYFEKPLISTDAEWARASCGDAAIYIDPFNQIQSAEEIHKVLSSAKNVGDLVKRGAKQLALLNRGGNKDSQYFAILEAAQERAKAGL